MADYDLKAISADTDGPSADTELLFGAPDQSAGTPKPYSFAGIKTWVKSWIAKSDIGLGSFPGWAPAATGIANVYNANGSTAQALNTITALRLYMVPVYWPGGTATGMAFTVSTGAAAGKVARIGVYNIKSDGTPGTLVIEPTAGGAIAVDTTGTKTSAFSQAMNAGWYYLAIISDGTPTTCISTDALGTTGMAFSGTTVCVPVTYVFRNLGALAALGDESANSFTAPGAGSTRPLLGIK